ncbi:MAG: hypothetical protein K0S32_3521 [Bacteroidetes bacterium]|nr:hypothetical protein [Bacteroidota bacterium]
MKTNNRSYSEMLFGTIGGKAFVLMIVVFLYAILDKKGLFAFAMHFIAHYILFTVFEIRYLLLIIKKRETQKT